MNVQHHLLTGTEVTHLLCDKCTVPMEFADMIVLHTTDGSNAMSAAQYLARRDTSVSAHVVVSRTGNAIQVLPFNITAWHAGRSFYGDRVNLNHCSIGIELDNAGPLHKRKNRFYTWYNKEIAPEWVYSEFVGGRMRYWHRFTTEQIALLIEICRLLVAVYPIKYLLRHSDITTQKIDPGPAFPFDEVMAEVMRSEG